MAPTLLSEPTLLQLLVSHAPPLFAKDNLDEVASLATNYGADPT